MIHLLAVRPFKKPELISRLTKGKTCFLKDLLNYWIFSDSRFQRFLLSLYVRVNLALVVINNAMHWKNHYLVDY